VSSTANPVEQDPAEISEFPMSRATGCPLDPPPRLRELQRECPVTRVRLWDGSTPLLVTGYAEQRALLADPRVSAERTRPGYPLQAPSGGASLSFIAMDDPEHARQRRMVQGAFTVKRIAGMRPTVQRMVDDAIDALLAGPTPVDLVEALALPVPSLVICTMLGVPYEEHEFFQGITRTLVKRSSTAEQRDGARRQLAGYLDGLVGARLEHPGDDLISGLAGRVAAGELSRPAATQTALLLLVAGHETTANMIALGTLALLEHPDQLAALRGADDPQVVGRAVEELLRYLTIVHGGRRRVALEDIEVGGRTVPAGTGLVLANDVGNRDPDVFADPDRLDLTRDAHHHVAFGFGMHQCLGQPLARMELQIVYSTLYRRIPTLRLAVERDQLRFKDDGLVYGVYELPVTW
jgi:cytochrome P450